MSGLRVASGGAAAEEVQHELTADRHDRVAEAYYGHLGEHFQQETRARIHWICEKVQGKKVLDVGCSQGIVPILLGREGKLVTGIDVDENGIKEAGNYLQNENESVKQNVTFLHADFLSHRFGEECYETIILTEVLEHITQPENFIDSAAKLLTDSGRLIVTVPFGINDFIDHKHTFYLLEPYRLVSKHFTIQEVKLFGKWIGLIGIKSASAENTSTAAELDSQLVSQLESSFLILERDLQNQMASLRAHLTEANRKYRVSTEQIAGLKQEISQKETTAIESRQSLAVLQSEMESLQSLRAEENQRLEQEIVRLTKDGHAKSQAVHDFEKQLIRREAELEALRERLDEANQKYRASTEQVAATREKLAQQETARHSLEDSLTQARAEIEKLQSLVENTRDRLEKETEGLRREIGFLTEEGHAKSEAVHDFEKQLIRREAELEALRERLDEANQKYRASTDQVAAAREKLALLEAARKSAEEDLAKARIEIQEIRGQFAKERSDARQEIARLSEDSRAKEENLCAAEKRLHALSAEFESLQSRLDEANRKYRETTSQVSALRTSLDDEASARIEVESKLKTSLDEANSKYRIATGQEIPRLKQKLEIQDQRYREKLDQVRLEAERQVAKARDTLSFRLGYILLHCFKSLQNFLRLPKDLWRLRQDSVRRKRKSKNREFAAPKVSKGDGIIKNKTEIALLANEKQISPVSSGDVPALDIANGLKTLRVACIMDEFTFGSYAPECRLTQLTPECWEAELEDCAPELLFIESAWRGKDELWGNRVGHASSELQGIVKWCRERKIPTVFWNKEDPVHFETFLNTARLFDFVFTTDIDCIHRYKAALGHERVFLLPFACQPEVHNPIETYERKDAFCFAGAYYVRYPERTRDLENFVEELPAFKPLEIYDRNYGKDDPNYMFPSSYQPYIVGTLPFTEIDKAYKGYRYAINLNSIKQSQSMFARRVFELLASNTITVSNFSRGIRLLFGDLVVTTDSGSEQVQRLKEWTGDELQGRKLRLAALRKVMQEHTYGQRLAYVASQVSGKEVEAPPPHIAVLARARSRGESKRLLESFARQTYPNTSLYLVVDKGASPTEPINDERVICLKQKEINQKTIGDMVGDAGMVAGMVAGDYYGPNYLLDFALATRYTDAQLIGKGGHFIVAEGEIVLNHPEQVYRPVQSLNARSAAIRTGLVAEQKILTWLSSLPEAVIDADSGLALDEFNYCRNSGSKKEAIISGQVDDLADLDTGISLKDLLDRAERIPPEETPEDDSATLSGRTLAQDFSKGPSKAIQLRLEGESWHVESNLEDGKHEYLYATADHTPASLGFKDELKVFFDTTPGLNIQLVVFFLDAQKQKIGHVILHPNRNQEADIPMGTAFIRFGLRFYAGGSAEIKGLVLGHRNLQPAEMLGRADHLLLTNHYPSYEDLYRNGFVHSRVRAYRDRGCRVDVYRLRNKEAVSYHEFEDIDVITGSQEVLHQMLSSGRYKSVLVHFLDEEMWEVLRHHIDHIKVNVWVHGAEIQPWHRREYNFSTEQERAAAKVQSERRMKFWRNVLSPVPENMRLIFVSQYFAEEVMEDLGFRIPEERYTVIHNPIDTDIFSYEKKSPDQRKKILSIRPYASAKYANDLSVKAIEELSKKPFFKELEFRMIGDGALFEETLAPLRKFENIVIERGFLSQSEIADLHKSHGIFMVPTRMDAQGVSRDEAMASGLVPVTNRVAAIPEFVDEECGALAGSEDFKALADGIALLYENEDAFLAKSQKAAERVRQQSAGGKIINRELQLFTLSM